MNHFDLQLTYAAPISDMPHAFTRRVLARIDEAPLQKRTKRFTWPRRIALAALAVLCLSALSFTGYAYAIGSNPIEIITRLVEGNTIKAHYKNRTFSYGKKLTYSDGAITAQAELGTIGKAHFYAAVGLQVPKHSMTYLDNPDLTTKTLLTSDTSPVIATVQKSATGITVNEKYLVGDKVDTSRKLTRSYTIPLDSQSEFRYYNQLTSAKAPAAPTLAVLYGSDFLKYHIGDATGTPTNVYFGFKLTHPLADYVEANQPITKKQLRTPDMTPLIEERLGAGSNICGNNGQDSCPLYGSFASGQGAGLYGSNDNGNGTTTPASNQNADPSLLDKSVGGSAAPGSSYIGIDLQGTITAISSTHLTIKTSSGTVWHLTYTKAQQANFARTNHPLQKGDTIVGMVYQSILHLNNRSIADSQIYSLVKF